MAKVAKARQVPASILPILLNMASFSLGDWAREVGGHIGLRIGASWFANNDFARDGGDARWDRWTREPSKAALL